MKGDCSLLLGGRRLHESLVFCEIHMYVWNKGCKEIYQRVNHHLFHLGSGIMSNLNFLLYIFFVFSKFVLHGLMM